MPGRRKTLIALLVISLIAAAVAIDLYEGQQSPGEGQVTILDEDGTIVASVQVQVADSVRERYTGLSNTDELDENEGMLFVHSNEGDYAYVMRDMAFPIDIIFIDATQHITTIYHAQVEEPPLTRYEGRGKWVLEVPYGWTQTHNVTPGMAVEINLAS